MKVKSQMSWLFMVGWGAKLWWIWWAAESINEMQKSLLAYILECGQVVSPLSQQVTSGELKRVVIPELWQFDPTG